MWLSTCYFHSSTTTGKKKSLSFQNPFPTPLKSFFKLFNRFSIFNVTLTVVSCEWWIFQVLHEFKQFKCIMHMSKGVYFSPFLLSIAFHTHTNARCMLLSLRVWVWIYTWYIRQIIKSIEEHILKWGFQMIMLLWSINYVPLFPKPERLCRVSWVCMRQFDWKDEEFPNTILNNVI